MALTQVQQELLNQNATSIGVGQTWQNMTSSRAINTTYTNTTGKAILVQICAYSGVGNNRATLTVGGLVVSGFKDNDYYTASTVTPHPVTLSAIVPNGTTYSLGNTNSGTTIDTWAELR